MSWFHVIQKMTPSGRQLKRKRSVSTTPTAKRPRKWNTCTKNKPVVSTLCKNVLEVVFSFLEEGCNGLLRLVCRQWMDSTNNRLLSYAVITTKELFVWAKKQSGFNRDRCGLVLAFHGRRGMLRLLKPCKRIKEKIHHVHCHMLSKSEKYFCSRPSVHKTTWKRWGWNTDVDNKSIPGIRRCNGPSVFFETSLSTLCSYSFLCTHWGYRGRGHLPAMLSRGLVQTKQHWSVPLRFRQNHCIMPVSSMEWFVRESHWNQLGFDEFYFKWIALNVHVLMDARVLGVINCDSNLLVCQLMRALATRQEYQMPPIKTLGSSSTLWLALAFFYANANCIKAFYPTGLEACYICAIEHLVITDRLDVLQKAGVLRRAPIKKMLEQIRRLCIMQVEPRYADRIVHANKMVYDGYWSYVPISGDHPYVERYEFFAQGCLKNDGNAAHWMSTRGRILPIDVARVVVRNPNMHKRALEFGFVLPDMAMCPVC